MRLAIPLDLRGAKVAFKRLALLACFLFVLAPTGASAASFSGPTDLPYGQSATWTISYTDAYGYGCGAGTDFCSATIYYFDDNDVKRLYSGCGDPRTTEHEACAITATPTHINGNILTHSTTSKYQVCDGLDVACDTKTVTWPPFPVHLTLTGVPDGNGSVKAKVSNGSDGLPGSVDLFDGNRGQSVPGGYASGDSMYWNLSGCAARTSARR